MCRNVSCSSLGRNCKCCSASVITVHRYGRRRKWGAWSACTSSTCRCETKALASSENGEVKADRDGEGVGAWRQPRGMTPTQRMWRSRSRLSRQPLILPAKPQVLLIALSVNRAVSSLDAQESHLVLLK